MGERDLQGEKPQEEKPRQGLSRDERARLDAIFGDVLPETAAGDRVPDPEAERGRDAFLRRQVPPHHG